MVRMPNVAPSDIYPAVRRFLLESGLSRALKSFDKETSCGEDVEAVSPKAQAFADLELTEACALWLEKRGAVAGEGVAKPQKKRKASTAELEEASPEEPVKKKKKSKKDVEVEEEQAAEAVDEPALEEQPKKKGKAKAEEPAAEEEQPKKKGKKPAEAAEEAVEQEAKAGKKDKKKDKEERKAGVPFSRVDHEKWTKAISDDRLKDNTHKAKNKFGDSAGDSWGDKASEDMLKVKGKGFRKEMAKKKRASWKGTGELDQGVNSIPFSDSDDE